MPGVERGRLVGRRAEIGRLRALLRDAAAGQPVVALVGGDAGVGKTRLVTEFANEMSAGGARVVVGNCPPVAPGLVPFAPVVEVLRELGPTAAQGLAVGHVAAIGRLLQVELPAARMGIPGETDRARLLGAVRAVLERAVCAGPLLAVFEDLHWADASTHEVLASSSARRPLACMYRTSWPSWASPPAVRRPPSCTGWAPPGNRAGE